MYGISFNKFFKNITRFHEQFFVIIIIRFINMKWSSYEVVRVKCRPPLGKSLKSISNSGIYL